MDYGKCKICSTDLIKEKFSKDYDGVESKMLRCVKCGIWISENTSDKNKMEKKDK
jgi:hypothetical protein